MRSAPRRLCRFVLTGLTAGALCAAEPAPRSAPTRPGATKLPAAPAATAPRPSAPAVTGSSKPATRPAPKSTTKPAAAPRVELIDLVEVASRLSLKPAAGPAGREVVLADRNRRLELEADSREARINGLRVFLGHPVVLRSGKLHVSAIDYQACLVPLLRPSLMSRLPPAPKVIVLDPGHGGVDQGTQNPRLGLKEKVFTLDVALRLKKRLEGEGFKVVLTRETDERLDLTSRPIIANRAGADLFVSIHFNALPNDQKTRGTEIFTFAPAHQRSTNAWGGGQTDDTEHEPAAVNRFDAASAMLAHALHRELLGQLETFDRGKKIGHLGMLRGLNCPAALVESGFLSNDEEAKKIATPFYRQQIAEALATGILDYAKNVEGLRAKQ